MRYLFVVLGLIGGIHTSTIWAAEPQSWLPGDINAVALVNVAEVYKTPLAQKEGWIRQAAESFIQQQSFIPPGTEQILIGAELDLSEGLTATRKYSVLVPQAGQSLEKLSAWFPAGIEKVGDKAIAQFGTDGFVADTGDGCWLAISASRQNISRWLRNGPNLGGNQLPKYLRKALTSANNKSQVLLAIDLLDNFSEKSLVDELKATDWFKSDVVVESNAKILASVEGITIGISVDKDRIGHATLDFGKETAALKPVLGKLVDAVMHRAGISTDDIESWKWDVAGKQITGSGPVSAGGVRRLLSILDPPSITHAISAATTAEPPTPEERMAKTSHKFLKSVQVLLDDLRETLNKTKDNHAVYFERYARKIDDLPKLNVDPQLLDFSAKVSNSLRYQAQTLRMQLMNAGTRKLQTYASSSSYVGPYGWYATMPNAGTGSVIDAQANQAAKSVRFSEWKQIEDGLVAVRRAMTEKYRVEF